MNLVNIVFVFTVGFLIRLVFGTIGSTSDQWVSFWNIKRQQNHKWINYELSNNVNEGTNAYPSLYHYIISRFPEGSWGIVAKIFNVLPDLVVGLFLFVALKNIDPNVYAANEVGRDSFICFILLLYFFNSSLFPPNARLVATNGRSFGFFLYTMLIALCFVIVGDDFSIAAKSASFVGAIFFYILIILSSLFGFQAATFSLLFLGIFYFSLIPILVIAAGLAASYVFKGLKSWVVVRHWWAHKKWYVKNKNYFRFVGGRNKIEELVFLPVKLFKDPREAIQIIFKRSSYISFVYMNIALFFILFLGLQNGFGLENEMVRFCLVITGIALIAFLLTSQKAFSHYGQAERYLEYATPFYIFAYAGLSLSLPPSTFYTLTFLLLLMNITGILINMLYINRQKLIETRIDPEGPETEVIEWINQNTSGKNFACNPIKLGHYFPFYDRANNKYYVAFLLKEDEKAFEDYTDYSNGFLEERDGFARHFDACGLPPAELKRRFDIDYLIIKSSFLSGYRKVAGDQFNDLKQLFSNTHYTIFQL